MPAAHDVQPGKGDREEAKELGMLDDQRETVLTMWRGSTGSVTNGVLRPLLLYQTRPQQAVKDEHIDTAITHRGSFHREGYDSPNMPLRAAVVGVSGWSSKSVA